MARACDICGKGTPPPYSSLLFYQSFIKITNFLGKFLREILCQNGIVIMIKDTKEKKWTINLYI